MHACFNLPANLCADCYLRLMCSYMILQELLAQEGAQSSNSFNQEVDLDELMDVSLMVLLPSGILMQLLLFIRCT